MSHLDGFYSSIVATRYTAFDPLVRPELALFGTIDDDERIAVLGGVLRGRGDRYRRLGMVVLRSPHGDRSTYTDCVPRRSVVDTEHPEWGPGRAMWLTDQGGYMPQGPLAIYAGHALFTQIYPMVPSEGASFTIHEVLPCEPPPQLAAAGLAIARYNTPYETLLTAEPGPAVIPIPLQNTVQ